MTHLRPCLALLASSLALLSPGAADAQQCSPKVYFKGTTSGCGPAPANSICCENSAFYCGTGIQSGSTNCPATGPNCGSNYPQCTAYDTSARDCAPVSPNAVPVCNAGTDPLCTGPVNPNCSTCKNPFAGGNGCQAGGDPGHTQAGADPILIGSQAAVTDPFTDFSVERVSKLSITRSYNSSDKDLQTVGAGGIFANAWHHDWEAHLTCSSNVCIVARGTLPGFQFSQTGTALSLDGTETWSIYTPYAPFPYKPPHQNLLVRRPSGEWIVFLTDGRELHFRSVCTSCDGSSSPYCTSETSGGRARLTRVVDPAGNGVSVGYDSAHGVLLSLTDDLGHKLEARSAGSCQGYAAELRYDGAVVAKYTTQVNQLMSAMDASGRPLRSYVYRSIASGVYWPRLGAINNESGNPIAEFSYDSIGRAIGVVDAKSSVGVWYSTDGLQVAMTEYFRGPSGDTAATSSRTLDYFGRVTSMDGSSSMGASGTLTWTDDHHLSCSIDATGRVNFRDVDAAGRVVHTIDYAGQTCTAPATLPADSREEWREYGITRPIAQGVALAMDTPTRVWRRSTVQANGIAEEITDYNQAASSIDPTGYSCASSTLPAGSVACRRIQTGYIPGSAGAAQEKHATFYSYDAKGRLVRTYGPLNVGNPGANDVTPIEERTYWTDGETSARQGRLHEVKRYPTPTAQPLVTSYDYDAFGVSLIIAPDGSRTAIAHDVRGRPTIVSQSDAAGVVRATSETRYYDGTTPRLRILASGAAERYGYDLRGRLVKLERLSSDPEASGANPVVAWVEKYAYDQAGNRIHAERDDGAGLVVWSQDRAYDVQHHVVWESNPAVPSAAKTWAYDPSGFMQQSVDEEGRATSFTPDGLGRVASVQRSGIDAAGAPVSFDVATYLYGAGSDALAGVQDANSRSTSYAYDDFVRVQQVSAGTVGSRRFRYDARGNVVQRGDATVTVTYTYDGLDRVLTTQASNSADGSSVAYQYLYDEGTNRGRLTTALEPDRTVTYGYDWAGRMAWESVTQSGIAAPLVTQYAYDASGALTQLTYPSGQVVLYVRDALTGEVTAVQRSDGSALASSIAHLPGGALASLVFGNGQSLAQTFDLRTAPLTVASGPLTLSYLPTPAGDIGTLTDRSADPGGCVHAVTRTFGYDALDRLRDWSDTVTSGSNVCPAETIGEIAAGFAYADGTDRVASQWTPDTSGRMAYAFGYDGQGNVSAIGQYDAAGATIESAVCLRHDALGRLGLIGYTSTALTPGGTACVLDSEVTGTLARFTYDAQNRRVARQVNGQWTYFLMGSDGQPLSEVAPTGDSAKPWRTVREYVWLDGRPLVQVEYDAGGVAHTYYVHTDHLGTPRMMTNAAGTIVWSTFQRPYGEIGEEVVPDSSTGSTVVTNLRLPGQYDERLLGPLGLQGPYYNWNRWYLPGMGRYLEADPDALAGGFNTQYGVDWYGYGNQSPIGWIDPDGSQAAPAIPLGPVWPTIPANGPMIGGGVGGWLGPVLGGLGIGIGIAWPAPLGGDPCENSPAGCVGPKPSPAPVPSPQPGPTPGPKPAPSPSPGPAPGPGGGGGCNNCPPCVGPMRPPRVDTNHSHGPCPGAHVHYWVWNQDPHTCICRDAKRFACL